MILPLCTLTYHKDLKLKMKWVINTIMKDGKFIYVSNNGNYVSWKYRNNTSKIDAKALIKFVNYLIDNICITVGDKLYRQVIGIPMGTDCAPCLANLEFDFLDKMPRNIYIARSSVILFDTLMT